MKKQLKIKLSWAGCQTAGPDTVSYRNSEEEASVICLILDHFKE